MGSNPIGILQPDNYISRGVFENPVMNQVFYHAMKSSEAGRMYKEAKASRNLEEQERLEGLVKNATLEEVRSGTLYHSMNTVSDRILRGASGLELVTLGALLTGIVSPVIGLPALAAEAGVRLASKVIPALGRAVHDKNVYGVLQDAVYAGSTYYFPIIGSVVDAIGRYNTKRGIVNMGIRVGKKVDARLDGRVSYPLHLSGRNSGEWGPVLSPALSPAQA